MRKNRINFIDRTSIVKSRAPKKVIRKTEYLIARQGGLKAGTEMINTVLYKLIEHLYKTVGGEPVNVRLKDFRITIAMPTSSKHYKSWGLRKIESVVLRKWLVEYEIRNGTYHKAISNEGCTKPKCYPPLFIKDCKSNLWYINLPDYPTYSDALEWLEANEIPLKYFRYTSNQSKNQYKAS